LQVATTLHKIEQAKYWVSLKQKHSNPSLHARGKAAVEEQMAACFKSMYKPPGKELAGMVQAACEEEVRRLLACDSLLLPLHYFFSSRFYTEHRPVCSHCPYAAL